MSLAFTRKSSVLLIEVKGFSHGSMVENLPANAGDVGSFPGLGRSPRGGNGNLLQYSFLENPTDRGAWWATVHRFAKSWIWLSTHSNSNTDKKVCGRCSRVSDCWEQRQKDEGNRPVLRALGSSTPEATAFARTLGSVSALGYTFRLSSL